jgi:hypothetical protein
VDEQTKRFEGELIKARPGAAVNLHSVGGSARHLFEDARFVAFLFAWSEHKLIYGGAETLILCVALTPSFFLRMGCWCGYLCSSYEIASSASGLRTYSRGGVLVDVSGYTIGIQHQSHGTIAGDIQ